MFRIPRAGVTPNLEPAIRYIEKHFPFGCIANYTLATAFTTTGTHTTYQDEGLTKSITVPANRLIKVTATVNPFTSGGANTVKYKMLHGSTAINEFFFYQGMFSTTIASTQTLVGFYTSSAVTESVKLQIAAATSNTAVDSYGSSTQQRYLIIEDMGPSV